LSPFHLASYLLIGGGFWAIAAAWPHLLRAAERGQLVVTGVFSGTSPQYVGFLLVMVGFLLPWPTIPTVVSSRTWWWYTAARSPGGTGRGSGVRPSLGYLSQPHAAVRAPVRRGEARSDEGRAVRAARVTTD